MKNFVVFWSLFMSLTGHAGQQTDNRVAADPEKYQAVGRLYALIPANFDAKSLNFEGDYAKRLPALIAKNQSKGLETQMNFCTAVLTAQSRVVTAAHCAQTFEGFEKLGIQSYFQPAKAEEKPVAVSSYSYFGSFRSDRLLKDDWAFLILRSPIRNIEPLVFLVGMTSEKKFPSPELISVGYPMDAQGKAHNGFTLLESKCHFIFPDSKSLSPASKERSPGADITDCIISEGNSGGPLLMVQQTDRGPKLRIVGISVGAQKSAWLDSLMGYSHLAFSVPSDVISGAVR